MPSALPSYAGPPRGHSYFLTTPTFSHISLVGWLFHFRFAPFCIAVEETAAGFTPSARHSLLNVREAESSARDAHSSVVVETSDYTQHESEEELLSAVFSRHKRWPGPRVGIKLNRMPSLRQLKPSDVLIISQSSTTTRGMTFGGRPMIFLQKYTREVERKHRKGYVKDQQDPEHDQAFARGEF